MFDVGFSELVLILVVALIVVGPERLPRLARTAGIYLGRARRAIASVKADVQRELAAEELKRTLQDQARSAGIHEIIEETQDAAAAAERFLREAEQSAAQTLPDAAAKEALADPNAKPTPGSQHGGD